MTYHLNQTPFWLPVQWGHTAKLWDPNPIRLRKSAGLRKIRTTGSW